ncbi:MAG TPA: AI-2E family transporter [Terriglobales bacterium]|nr:AI-2E family transporter [Terriglobales bacterium]
MPSSDRVTEMPQAVVSAASAEEEEVLHASIKAGSIAQIVVAVAAVLGLIYFLKLVMITTLTSMLLAFVLEPLVGRFGRLKVARAAGSLIAVLLMTVLTGALSYFFFNRAVDFAAEAPKYSGKIRATVGNIRSKTSKIEESTNSVVNPSPKKDQKAIPVTVEQRPGLSRFVSETGSTVVEAILAISFVPFLVFFMLTWKEHAHLATVRLFPKEHRLLAHRTIGRISNMIRSFIVGNVVVGLVISGVSVLVFWILGIKYFYFIGVISGFVSLIPYLGVFLALLPPLAAGIESLNKTGALMVLVTVVGLHLLTMNVLYPKLVGRRLRLNPLAVTLALLFWAWIWGAMGLVLAIPIVGATKIICDHIDSLRGLGAWIGEAGAPR